MKRRTMILLAMLLVLLVGFFALSRVLAGQIHAMEQRDAAVDMALVPDGVYRGIQGSALVRAEVEVDVQDHCIAAIRLISHRNGRGQAAEAMLPAMQAANSPDVDIVSGATLSSLVIRSAVLNALEAAGGKAP